MKNHQEERMILPSRDNFVNSELENLTENSREGYENGIFQLNGPLPPSYWLTELNIVVRRYHPWTIGIHSVYIVLLHNIFGTGDFGVYVGQTSMDPRSRYREHRMNKYCKCRTGYYDPDDFLGPSGENLEKYFTEGYDYNRGCSVRKYGIALLQPNCSHLRRMDPWEALILESYIAKDLKAIGFTVRGGH